MNTKIDLESAIMVVWQTSEDLDLLFCHHGDHPEPMTEDEVANALLGIKTLHDLRMQNLMRKYSQKFELDEYCTDPHKLEARENLFDLLTQKPKKKGSKK